MKSSTAFALCSKSLGISDFPCSLSRSNIPLMSVQNDSMASLIDSARISCSSVIPIYRTEMLTAL